MTTKKFGKFLLLIFTIQMVLMPVLVSHSSLLSPTGSDQLGNTNGLGKNIGDYNLNSSPISATDSQIQLSGTQLFQLPVGSSSTPTSISSVDFTRNSTSTHERWDDFLMTDDSGRILTREGTYYDDPFTAFGWGHEMAISQTGLKTIYAQAVRLSTLEKRKYNMFVAFNTTVGSYTYDATDSSHIYYFTTSEWTFHNNTDTSGYIVDQTIQCVIPVDFNAPYIEGEYLIGTSQGRVILVDATNILTSTTPFSEVLVNNGNSGVIDMAVFDYDHDSNLDIVVLYENSSIKVYRGDKASLYTSWSSGTIINSGETDVLTHLSAADLDNDGYDDLIVSTNAGRIKLFRNLGGSFSSPYLKNNFGVSINDIKTGDMDNDNDLDIVLALNNGSVVVLENHYHYPPTLSSGDAIPIWASNDLYCSVFNSVGGYATIKLLITDYNQDSWLDVISAHQNGYVYGWKNNKITLINPFNLGRQHLIVDAVPSKSLFDIKFGDIDLDGDLDIVAVYNSGGSGTSDIYFYYNPGVQNLYQAEFTSDFIYGATGDFKDIALYDLDHDGDLDIVYSIYEIDGTIRVKALENPLNDTNGVAFSDIVWTDSSNLLFELPSTSLSGRLRVQDITGDGSPDIMIKGTLGNLSIYDLSSPNLDPFDSLSWDLLYGGNIIANTTDSVQITGLDIADVENYWVSVMPTTYDFAPMIDDIAFSDKDGNVYFLPGQLSLENYRNPSNLAVLPDNLIGSNSSIKIQNLHYVYDHYRRKPTMIVAGYLTDSPTQGYIGNYYTYSTADVTSWTYSHRASVNTSIYDFYTGDLDLDGNDDIIFNDGDFNLQYCAGISNYFTGEQLTPHLLLNTTEIGITPKFNGYRFSDLDGDGDLDVMMLSSDDQIYFFKNSLGDDITTDFLQLTVDPEVSATQVEISVDVLGTKTIQQTPVLNITYKGVSEYYTMNIDSIGKNYSFTYTLKGNGTYYVSTNATDQWENFVEVSSVFYGDFITPGLSISYPNYSNGSIEIYVYNTTETIGNNSIGLNVTADDPAPRRYFFETVAEVSNTSLTSLENNKLYYLGNDTWWIKVTGLDLNTVYTIGVNATDIFFVNYTYFESTFINDIIPPSIYLDSPSMLPTKTVSIDIRNPVIPLYLNFKEEISYLKYWVVDENGTNVLYGDSPYVEEWNVGDSYISSFRTTITGNLVLHFLMKDVAGNYNEETYSFELLPFHIENVQYFVVSPLGNRMITHDPVIYVHFKGYGIYDFKIKVLNPNNTVEFESNWTSYNFLKDEYYNPENPTLGYAINLTSNYYGQRTIILQLRNSYETITMPNLNIDYQAIESQGFDWTIVLYGALGVAGAFIAFVSVKKIIQSREWKKYLAFTEMD